MLLLIKTPATGASSVVGFEFVLYRPANKGVFLLPVPICCSFNAALMALLLCALLCSAL